MGWRPDEPVREDEWYRLFELMAKINAQYDDAEDQRKAVEAEAHKRSLQTHLELVEFCECMKGI